MKLNLIGRRTGQLTITKRLGPRRKGGKVYWQADCTCGGQKEISSDGFRRGIPASCGCRKSADLKARTGGLAWNWRGGVIYDDSGYRLIRIPQHPRAKSNGYVREHIVVMEAVLGRPLTQDEQVHHKNNLKADNRPENLELWNKSQPSGARVEDLVEWAKKLLEQYGAEIDNLPRSTG